MGKLNVEAASMAKAARVWLLLVLFALGVGVAAGCGGQEEGPASTSPASTADGATTALPCQALEELKTYRYTTQFTIEVETPPGSPVPPGEPSAVAPTGPTTLDYKMEASFVAPDRIDVVGGIVGSEAHIIAIGDVGWLEVADGWQQDPRIIVPYQPRDVCQGFVADLDLSSARGEPEELNGLTTHHYSFSDVAAGEALAVVFGAQSDLARFIEKVSVDVWLADKEEWPARIEAKGAGQYPDGRALGVELQTELRDVNSSEIKVEPPP